VEGFRLDFKGPSNICRFAAGSSAGGHRFRKNHTEKGGRDEEIWKKFCGEVVFLWLASKSSHGHRLKKPPKKKKNCAEPGRCRGGASFDPHERRGKSAIVSTFRKGVLGKKEKKKHNYRKRERWGPPHSKNSH